MYKARCAYIAFKYSLKSPVIQTSSGVHGKSTHSGLITVEYGWVELILPT